MFFLSRARIVRNIIRYSGRKSSSVSDAVCSFTSAGSRNRIDADREAHAAALRLLDNREQPLHQKTMALSSSALPVLPKQSTNQCPLALDSETKKAFSRIYAQDEWGAEARSGLGSREDTTREFRSFLESFLLDRRIKSVVDAGCGHWPTGYQRFMHWHKVHYCGIDVVPVVVEENSTYLAKHEILETYGLSSADFKFGDLSEALPPADLLLVKDVLMHLPTAAVNLFLKNNVMTTFDAPRYKAVLLVENEVPFNLREFMDIEPGQLLPFDISKPPFDAPFIPVFRWQSDEAKLVQLWES